MPCSNLFRTLICTTTIIITLGQVLVQVLVVDDHLLSEEEDQYRQVERVVLHRVSEPV